MPDAATYTSARSSASPSAPIMSVPPVSPSGISSTSGAADQAAALGGFREAVCLNAGRVYDSCSGRDCLEVLPLYLTAAGNAVIDSGSSVKCRSIDVIHTALSVEEVPFNAGYYTVDMIFYFLVTLDVFAGCTPGCAAPQTVQGIAAFEKKVILFGSEGRVRSFRSGGSFSCGASPDTPSARVQTVDPICLGLKVCDEQKPGCGGICLPPEMETLIGGTPAVGNRYLYLTIGMFTIVSLEREIQMMVPVYDYCLPEKECESASAEDPCALFEKLRFPVSEFFPPKEKGTCE